MGYGSYDGPEVYGEELLAIVDLIKEALKSGRKRNRKVLKQFVESRVVQDDIRETLRQRDWRRKRKLDLKEYNEVEYDPT
jgi:hypothetical protein